MKEVRLGCGLVSIGRGFYSSEIPAESEARDFLEKAYEMGIDFYDTAPSYGLSELRLGKFLKSLTNKERDRLTIATKFGERWDAETNIATVDHTYEGLVESLARSIDLLGKIDILYLHKTTPDVLRSTDFNRAIEYARSLGIDKIGASVTDLESAGIVCGDDNFRVIQFPFNASELNKKFTPVFSWSSNKLVVINRPFRGATIYQPVDRFRFVIEEVRGEAVILTGTKNLAHLIENISAFRSAQT